MTYLQLRKYIIAALGLVGVVSLTLYTGGINRQERTVDPITVDGQTITFTCTDSVAGEDLIIMLDKCEYTDGLSHATVYVAVANISDVAQDVELAAFFRSDDGRKRIKDVSVLGSVTQEYFDPIYTTTCEDVTNATGTTQMCTDVQTGTSTRQETNAIWGPLPTISRDTYEIAKEAGWLEGKTREQVEGFAAALKSVAFPVRRNEVIYYKVNIEFPPNQRDEFFFQAFGSAGGYGFMR